MTSNPFSLNTTLLCDTSHLAIIKISGEDASAFLQGQFSNDINLLQNPGIQLNSYNSPKGRMYASFHLLRLDDDFFMLLPTDVIEPVLKRLKMFVMRSNVTLQDMSSEWKTFGLSGDMSDEDLQKKLAEDNIALPENSNEVSANGNNYVCRLTTATERFLFIGPESDINSLKSSLSESLTVAGYNHWKRLDIEAGIPNIYANTQESFVAQMVNLQLIDGVSFTKGCYPGQEVVARMHYLGKLKKRMYHIISDTEAKPNDKIFNNSADNEQSVGQIVDAQLNEDGKWDALAVIQVAAVESNALKLNAIDGNDVELQTLPYSFPED